MTKTQSKLLALFLLFAVLFLTGCPAPNDGTGDGDGNGDNVDPNAVKTPVATPVENQFEDYYLAVTLTSETEGATIYYTTDGTDPVPGESSEYTEAFEIYSAAVIKAIAVKDGKSNSSIMEKAYNQVNQEIVNLPNADAKISQRGDGQRFTWNAPGNGYGATITYDLYISTSQENMTVHTSDITDNEIWINDLQGGSTYYWKIVAKFNHGCTATSVVRSFTTEQTVNGSWMEVEGHGFVKVVSDNSYSIVTRTYNNTLYVLERRLDENYNNINTIKSYDGTSWTEVYADDAEADNGIVAFNIDNNGVPNVVIKQSPLSSDPFTLYQIIGGSLVQVGNSYSYYTTVLGDFGLMFDTSNNAFVTFDNSGPVIYKQTTATDWEQINTYNIEERTSERFTMLGDDLYVVYEDDSYLTTVKKNTSSTAWDIVGDESFGDDDGSGNFLVRDNNEDLFLVYQEGSHLSLYQLIEGIWVKQGESIDFVSIAGAGIDTNGNIYAQYTDMNFDTDPMTYDNFTVKFVNGEWAVLGNSNIDGFSSEDDIKAQLQIVNNIAYATIEIDGIVTIKKFIED